MSFEKILIAVDTSEDASCVIEAAKQVAGAASKLHLLTVVEPLASVYGSMIWPPAGADTHDIESTMMTQAAQRLQKLGSQYEFELENIHVKLGSPARLIREEASRLEVDLIVIGTHARHGLGLLLGSTANSVLHGVSTNVLVVRLADAQ